TGRGGSGTLALHWNGRAWKRKASRSPGKEDNLFSGVAAISRSDAWAVGASSTYGARILVEHWNGTAWSVKKTPKVTGESELWGVAAISHRNVWAVGCHGA